MRSRRSRNKPSGNEISREADLRVQTADASDMKLKGLEARAVQLRELARIDESLAGKRASVDSAQETVRRLSEVADILSGIGPGEDADVEKSNSY